MGARLHITGCLQGEVGCRVVRAQGSQGTPSLPLWFCWKDLNSLFWLFAKTPRENSESVEVVWIEDGLEQNSCFHLPWLLQSQPTDFTSPVRHGCCPHICSSAPTSRDSHQERWAQSFLHGLLCLVLVWTLKMQHLIPSLTVPTSS